MPRVSVQAQMGRIRLLVYKESRLNTRMKLVLHNLVFFFLPHICTTVLYLTIIRNLLLFCVVSLPPVGAHGSPHFPVFVALSIFCLFAISVLPTIYRSTPGR